MTKLRPTARSAWFSTLIFGLAAATLTVAAGLTMFSTFMFYDDEGYVLISLRNFAEHGRLYGEVFSQYGPFPFVVYYALHTLGLPLTHTVGRILTIGAWSGAAIASAALVGHATRSLTARLAVVTSVFVYLWVMVSEPSHPGGLIAVITAILAWLGHRWISTGRIRAWALLVGAGAGAMALTKINVGVFAGLSAITWLLLHHDSPIVRRRAPTLLAIGVVLFPFALMRPLLDQPWALTFAVMFACAGLTAVGAATLETTQRAGWRTAWAGLLAALAVVAVVFAIVCARGTTPADLLEGVLLRPLRNPVLYVMSFEWPAGSFSAAAVAAVLFAVAWILRRRGVAKVDSVIALLRLIGAVALFGAVARFPGISPDRLVLAFALPWLWVFLWPLAGEEASAVAARRWVGWLFLGQSLHAFPVPGSQIAWGTFLIIPLAALGGWSAAAWLAPRFSLVGAWSRAQRVAIHLVIVAVAINTGWRLVQVGRHYVENADFGLPGAEHLRLPDRTTALYHVLTLNAVAHDDMLFTLPGLFSFNLWTGLPTPTLANVTQWFALLDEAQQHAIIRSLDAHPRACVIVQRGHVDFLTRRGVAPSGSLYNYIAKNFESAFAVDEFEFWVRRGRRIAPFSTASLFERPGNSPTAPADSPRSLLKLQLLLPANRAIARFDVLPMDATSARLVLTNANAQIQVTPINLAGDAVGPPEPRQFPFTLNGPARVDCYFDRGSVSIGLNSTFIVPRDSTGAELTLVRMLP